MLSFVVAIAECLLCGGKRKQEAETSESTIQGVHNAALGFVSTAPISRSSSTDMERYGKGTSALKRNLSLTFEPQLCFAPPLRIIR